MNNRVLCAGRLYCDLVFVDTPRLPTPGTEVFAPRLTLHAGGGAFITAATLASLGHRVSQYSTLPATPFDQIVRGDLTTYQVDASLCSSPPAATDPQITVAIAAAGERAFLTRADGPAIAPPNHIDFAGFQHLHIGELRTLQDVPDLLKCARNAGLTISMDCGWQDEYDQNAAALIASVDVFLPNEAEEQALAACGIPSRTAPLTAVKCGKDGARARRFDDADWTFAPTKPVTVVDATGAGDAFNAGFLSRWLADDPLATCLDNGNACGAAAVQSPGGAGCLPAQTAES